MIKGKKISRKEIAEAAGVSDAMVSYALSDNSKVKIKAETREKIRRIANEKGYMPNFIGKSLVNGKSYNIGILMPEQYTSRISLHNLNIFHGLALAIEETEYNLVVFFDSGNKYFKKIKQGRIDGIIILQSFPDHNVINQTLDTGLPTVIINLDFTIGNREHIACVRSDHELMVKECFKYFKTAGAQRILSINKYNNACDPNRITYEEFNRQCEKYAEFGISGSTMVPGENFDVQIRNMFISGQHWDGYFIVGSNYADTFLSIADEFDFKINRDFYLFISDTGIQKHKFNCPCYLHSQREMGKTAWLLLQKILEGKKLERNKILVPYNSIPTDKL